MSDLSAKSKKCLKWNCSNFFKKVEPEFSTLMTICKKVRTGDILLKNVLKTC